MERIGQALRMIQRNPEMVFPKAPHMGLLVFLGPLDPQTRNLGYIAQYP